MCEREREGERERREERREERGERRDERERERERKSEREREREREMWSLLILGNCRRFGLHYENHSKQSELFPPCSTAKGWYNLRSPFDHLNHQ